MLDEIKRKIISQQNSIGKTMIIDDSLTPTDYQTLNMIQENNHVDINDYYVSEWIKCRKNPLYYILNYVYFQEIGGKRKYDKELLHKKLRRMIRSVFHYHTVLLIASRQLGKALDVKTLIPLADGGYTTMKKIQVGDLILDENGDPTSVIAISEIMYDHKCYKLEFDNCKTPIIADAGHLWKITNKIYNFQDKILTTDEIFNITTNLPHYSIKMGCFSLKNIQPTESVPVKCITVENSSGMFLCSRDFIPTHNSTTAAGILSWAANFFPSNRIVILNFRKDSAQENLKKIKFINNNLPKWMRVPSLSKSEIKSYWELQNGSRVDTFYPSTTSSPDTLARSLSVPVLYIDEAAFIPHMHEIYGSAQPTLSTAREQAARNDYPYMILMTSTPNGVDGDGKFFYETHELAVDSDDIFIDNGENEKISEDAQKYITAPDRNSFVRIRYHWSENSLKTLAWYEQQKKELNFDQRKINQELDLLFVGGTYCIFDDMTLQKFKKQETCYSRELKNQTNLTIFDDVIDPQDFYLIGVDTASSIRGAFNAVEIFSYKDFKQIAELNVKLGSLTKYGEVVDDLFRWLYNIVGERIILAIENNSIGKAIIEHLLYHIHDFNYIPFIYKDLKKSEIPGEPIDESSHEYGINTNTRTKELMVSLFYDLLTEDPSRIKSQYLISQLSSIQRSNRGVIKGSSFSDMFMAGSFCAYARKMTQLKILPLLNYSNDQLSQSFFNNIKTVAQMMNTKLIIQDVQHIDRKIIKTAQEDEALTRQTHSQMELSENDWKIFMPIMTPID
ncbi:MAG: hypothetical protein PHD05_00840 [Sphaerochaetaceae bacterium]|nr:hypothetical protein [Sphaerochaetaceae bacterium]